PENQVQNNNKPVFLFIDANGNLSIDKLGITHDQIQEQLYLAILTANPAATNPFDERVYVRADFGLPYKDVLQVMDEVQGAGFYKVGLVTEDAEQAAPGAPAAATP
ncbi:MAG: biopolymer transporter ExbD, partial [Caulobacterales bacterium]